MEDHKESAMIALLPITTDWCRIELPHMTLIYAGETKDLPMTAHTDLVKDANALALLSSPLTLEVLSQEQFGNWSDKPEDMVDVYRLRPTQELWAMRKFVEKWNASEHDFNPHVTIGPVGQAPMYTERPRMLAFDRICVGWGKDYLTFNMRR